MTDNTVLLGLVTPIVALMIVYFAYTLIVFRRREDGPGRGSRDPRGPRHPDDLAAATSVIVLFLATYGTIRLFDEGSGGGQGADPVAKPSGSVLPVQVIAQQWAFAYRFPTFGGVETPHLELPVDRNIALHVTSLDVIHSFWAHDLGVRPTPTRGWTTWPTCGPERCGASRSAAPSSAGSSTGTCSTPAKWSAAAPSSPGSTRAAAFGPATGALPKFRSHYNPAPHRRAG